MNATRTGRSPVVAIVVSSPGACLDDPVLLSCTKLRKPLSVTFDSSRTPSMASDKPIRVAIIGLGFGAEFIPIYQSYPGAEMYAICRRDRKGLDECGEQYKIGARYTDYGALLADPN